MNTMNISSYNNNEFKLNQQLSLFIPRVFMNITSERIKQIFESLHFGIIKRVDLVNQGKYNRVYIHFEQWYNNSTNTNFQKRIVNKEPVRVVYDDPYFWIILENTNKTTEEEQN